MVSSLFPSHIKALLIDMDGTLINTLPLLFQVYKKFLKNYGVKGSKEEFAELNGPSLDEVLAILKKRYNLDGEIKSLLEEYQKDLAFYYSHDLSFFPHAKETIHRAKKNGLKVALVSSADESLIKSFVLAQKMENDFDALIHSEGLSMGKPAPDIYLHALKTLNVAANEALAIEDSLNGVMSSVNAGIFTFWLTHKKARNPISICDHPPCFKVYNWSAIDQFLEKLYV